MKARRGLRWSIRWRRPRGRDVVEATAAAVSILVPSQVVSLITILGAMSITRCLRARRRV